MLAHSIVITLLSCTLVHGAAVGKPEKVFYDLEKALDHFMDFVKTYNKVYEHGEATKRFQIFVENLKTINKRNKEDSSTHGINEYADMSLEEFAKYKFGARITNDSIGLPPVDLVDEDFEVPASIDWRDQNIVTGVKNQETCGSCWAFSAVAVIESQYAKKYTNLQEFSEQQLLDCDSTSSGCKGGSQINAFQYVQSNGGLEAESSYPYQGVQGQCNAQPSQSAVKVTSPQNSGMAEDQMAATVASYGPIGVIICAAELTSTYQSGVWTPSNCPANFQDCVNPQGNPAMHAVTIIGYGTDDAPYWLIKNSWGTTWGMQGYFKMRRDANLCFISTYISTVQVV